MYGTDSKENWAKIQDWLFDKILNRDEKILYRLKPLTGHDVKSGYLGRPSDTIQIDYQKVLFNASRSMIRFQNPHRLIKMIDRIINKSAGVTHTAALIYDNTNNSYALINSKGAKEKKISSEHVKLDFKSALIDLFRNKNINYFFENGVVSFRELKWILESGQLLTKDVYLHNKLRAVLKEMELLDAEVCIPCSFKKELLGVLVFGKKTSGRNFTHEEINLFTTLANDAAMAFANAKLLDNLEKKVDEIEHLHKKEQRLFMNTAVALAKAIDARDIYTCGHTERVTKYCLAIADELGYIGESGPVRRFKDLLHVTALLHDIGKIGIPDEILNKKRGLSSAERKIVEKHPEIGAAILYPIQELNEVAVCVRAHQEWYDGNGYPIGLKKQDIPLMARVVSVADAFDAMISDRPYRKRRSPSEAMEEIRKYSGTQFDPAVVEAFLSRCKKENLTEAISVP